MQKPRILIFSTAYYPLVGGAEVAIKEITDRLTDKYEFELITARLDRKLAKLEKVGAVLVHRIGFGNAFDKLLVPFVGAIRISKLKPDLCWAMMVSYASLSAYIFNFFKFWKKIPIALSLQEGDSEKHLTKRHFGLIDLSWRLALARTSYLTAISAYLLKRAKRLGFNPKSGINVGRVPNGASEVFFNVSRQIHNGFVLITTGRLVRKNGIEHIIRALPMLPDVSFVSVGDGELKSELGQLAESLGVGNRVTWKPFMPQEELAQELARADIFIRPSLSEGLGNSFLEAMAVGLPVIGTNVGGIPDFLFDGKTGLICEMNSPESIAEKVKMLMNDELLRKKIIEAGKSFVTTSYRWQRISGTMSEIFKTLLYNKKYKILIASPVAPGTQRPTHYSSELSRELRVMGHEVAQIVFSNNLPTGIRHVWFFLQPVFIPADYIIALDNFSVALPCLWAGLITGRKTAIRIGGDFLWESYVNRTDNLISLAHFYNKVQNNELHDLNVKEKIIKLLTGFIYRYADRIVFSTECQKNILFSLYKFNESRTFVISNYSDFKKEVIKSSEKNFVWIGRDIPLKNLGRLAQAFAIAKKEAPDIELQIYKNLPQEEVWPKLRSAYAFIYPSISEVSPNLVLQALIYNKPVIMTRESGFTDWLKDTVMLVDPTNEKEIGQAIISMASLEIYEEYVKKAGEFNYVHTYQDIAREFIKVI